MVNILSINIKIRIIKPVKSQRKVVEEEECRRNFDENPPKQTALAPKNFSRGILKPLEKLSHSKLLSWLFKPRNPNFLYASCDSAESMPRPVS